MNNTDPFLYLLTIQGHELHMCALNRVYADRFRWIIDEYLPVVRFSGRYFRLLWKNNVHHDGSEKRKGYRLYGLLYGYTFLSIS